MKPPKEPKSWRYPRMYVEFDKTTGELGHIIRTVFPNGRGDFDTLNSDHQTNYDFACWQTVNGPGYSDDTKSQYHAFKSRKAMFRYVQTYCSDVELIYIGEIK